ncbi:hypothetical protein ACZ90_36840 [Streptomyces albus subsp. albus]|nr:hypothetical protein ACZ90_36840 [Streptomyces albus subsp. albus]
MVRTTPPRPVDISALFPELGPLAREAVRLHPRPGAPTAQDSSVGGPLLWPADEPWPSCEEHAGPWHLGFAPEDVRLRRHILHLAWGRPRQPGEPLLTAEEQATIDRIGVSGTRIEQDGPVPLLPVAQLYARDLPELSRPEGTDLLQVLWCPFEHGMDCLPGIRLRWRDSTAVGTPLAAAPQPSVIDSTDYLPAPCVLHPEPVTEYPAPLQLPDELADRITDWVEQGNPDYQTDLSVAPGWKLGGWGHWSFSDPWPIHCTECGGETTTLLTVDSGEWGDDTWRPLEDADPADGHPYPLPHEPTQVTIGRGYTMQTYLCAAEPFSHPPVQTMQ